VRSLRHRIAEDTGHTEDRQHGRYAGERGDQERIEPSGGKGLRELIVECTHRHQPEIGCAVHQASDRVDGRERTGHGPHQQFPSGHRPQDIWEENLRQCLLIVRSQNPQST
jgi:hypothetical protein